jgi:peptidoglycan/LPS O-acetylase OafA/YrhL
LWRAFCYLSQRPVCDETLLHFKAAIAYTQTMLWFGVPAYYWIREEIAYGKYRKPNGYLVAAGAWSYSLNLVHVQGMELFAWAHPSSLGYILDWIITMTCSLGFANVFYLLNREVVASIGEKTSGVWDAASGRDGKPAFEV